MKLKICGVQSVEEAKQLADMGVDFVGLNFVPTSTRSIDLTTGQAIAEAVRNTPIKLVALFQNHPLDVVQEFSRTVEPDYVQLHGEEASDFIDALKLPVIKAMSSGQQLPQNATYFLLDRTSQGEGPMVDVDTVHSFITSYPDQVFLAGGLAPENLPNILDQVQPFGIDIASGVRTHDVLDFAKVAKVLEIMRRASA